jgi:tRNA modification GTPase
MNAARETIAAIATASGAAGVGIVRISGAQTAAIAEALLGRKPKVRYAQIARLYDAEGALIDHGIALFFKAPKSFTGEDVLELQAHGSPIALQLILQRCYALGARPARPGEFSERAYLNGKLDLAQAEAIADLIHAQTNAAARAAARSLMGEFSARVHAVLRELIALRTYVEALIDFPDEEIDFVHEQQIGARHTQLMAMLKQLLADTRAGQRLHDGLYVVIAGPPNAGKSSLLNALAGSDRAIVTAIAGTTRDVLRESLHIDGVPITLVDTAGLRQSPDLIEAEGIRRAARELEKADLALLLIGHDQEPDYQALQADLPEGIAVLRIRSKADQPCTQPAEVDLAIATPSHAPAQGLDQLREKILQHLQQRDGATGTFSARARHTAALVHVSAAIHDAYQARALGLEIFAEELRLAQRALSELTGEFSTEDLLGQIFSNFCIGK